MIELDRSRATHHASYEASGERTIIAYGRTRIMPVLIVSAKAIAAVIKLQFTRAGRDCRRAHTSVAGTPGAENHATLVETNLRKGNSPGNFENIPPALCEYCDAFEGHPHAEDCRIAEVYRP